MDRVAQAGNQMIHPSPAVAGREQAVGLVRESEQLKPPAEGANSSAVQRIPLMPNESNQNSSPPRLPDVVRRMHLGDGDG